MPTKAFDGFRVSIGDARQLFAIYEKERIAAAPRVPEEIEVLKRASLILAVTAWETYLEDLLKEKFPPRLARANSPKEFESGFNAVAAQWLDAEKGKVLQGLSSWTGEGWKTHMRQFFDARIAALNTPNSTNVRKLLKQFLGVDLSSIWVWRGYNFASACSRLDQVVQTRGSVTHVARRTPASSPTKHVVSRTTLKSYLQFIDEIAAATEKIP